MRKEYGTMKNNRFSKIIALLLSCLFIIGALTGLVVSAEEGTEPPVNEEEIPPVEEIPVPTATIKYKNVSYEGAVKLLFYVESADLVEGQMVKLLLADNAELTDVAVLSPIGKTTVGEGEAAATYDVFASEEIAPAAIRAAVYAAAVVVDSEGTVVSESEILEYSVFEYCMDRYDAAPTADQKALYTALLDFSASVQTVLGYTDETIDQVGGWANAYYGVKINTVIDDEVVSVDKHYFTAAEIGAVEEIPVEKFYTAGGGIARFTDVVADRGFDAVAAGSSVSVKVRGKVGFSSCELVYAGGGILSDFTVGKKPEFTGMTFPKASTAVPANDADGNGTPDGRYFVTLSETVKDADGNDVENVFARYVDDNDGGSDPFRWEKSPESGKTKYIIEFDFRWMGASQRRDNSADVIYYNDIGAMDNDALGSFTSSGDNKPLVMNGVTMQIGEWHNVQYVYELNDNGKFNISVYIDGKLGTLSGGKTTVEADKVCFNWEPRYGSANGSNNLTFDIDNIFYVAN